jgi:signal transduction histidine kinase
MFKTLKPGFLCLGIGCSFFLSLFLSEISAVRYLEAWLQDRLMVWQSQTTLPTNEIVLVKIRESDLLGSRGEQVRYAALAEHLLQKGAAVVVLNLLDNWTTDLSIDGDVPLQRVVEDYSDQVVLVTPTVQVNASTIPEIATYYHLLPPLVGNEMQSAYDVASIQGFFEFSNEAATVDSPARLAHTHSIFYYNDPTAGQTVGEFKSAALLAIEKFRQQQHADFSPTQDWTFQKRWPMKIHFFGDTNTSPGFMFEQVCLPTKQGDCADVADPGVYDQIRNKIVILGFVAPEDNKKVILPVQSPFGRQMSGIEVQANILASLMTDTLYLVPPRGIVRGVIVAGAILISCLISLKFITPLSKQRQFVLFLGLTIAGVYSVFFVAFLSQKIWLPLALPTLTWLSTGLILWIWLVYQAQQTLITQQRYEIAQLKSAESGAVILQTRKLLQRIASGIHEGPLQDLRLIMDKLELDLNTEPDLLVENLSGVGQAIRNYLQSIRNMADQLEVTPELRQGLANGIREYLKQLSDTGKLTLSVVQELQPLEEPSFDSQWIDAREDIFMFFREAIANIIAHAQPPHGNARQVIVRLFLQDAWCTLMIENDGSAIAESKSAILPYRRGGYGTKMMETAARSLPDGHWRKTSLTTGGYRVELIWRQQFTSAGMYNDFSHD